MSASRAVAIGAVCNGNRNLFNDGKQYGTTLQSPLHEGQLAIKLVDEYITTGALKKFINFTPNPPISIENIDTRPDLMCSNLDVSFFLLRRHFGAERCFAVRAQLGALITSTLKDN